MDGGFKTCFLCDGEPRAREEEEEEEGRVRYGGIGGACGDAWGRRAGIWGEGDVRVAGIEDVKAKITEENAFDVLRRCDELEAALDAAGAGATRPVPRASASASATAPANDAYRNFVFARDAQESSRRAREADAASGQRVTRRAETVAREAMFPRYSAHTSGRRGKSASSMRTSMSSHSCPPRQRRGGGNENRAPPPAAASVPLRRGTNIQDDVRTASHAAASAVKAAAEAVRRGPSAKGVEVAWRKERVALVREIGALRRQSVQSEQELRVLRQRAETREEDLKMARRLVRERDELILEAEARLKDLQRAHEEEIATERARAAEATSTRDNLALVYRTSLMRLLNDRCDACRANMNPSSIDDFVIDTPLYQA